MAATRLEEIRFGYGPFGSDSPAGTGRPGGGIDPDRLLAQLDGPDPGDERWRRPGLGARMALIEAARLESAARRRGETVEGTAGEQLKQMGERDREVWVPRAATTRLGFRERLVNLWANRLTVAVGKDRTTFLAQSFRDEAVRPHVGGRFADMLAASVFHPAMLVYLDQVQSVGPESPMGRRRKLGLNENLARELLELHAMGSGYTQGDVTELARLLAGLTVDRTGSVFQKKRAEPGQKTVLGLRYGTGRPEIRRLVENIAMRPETARSIARMLAGHFLSDSPPEPLVEAIAASYLAAGGELRPAYATLLRHPAAADPELRKIRSPHEYVAASLRALDMTGLETVPVRKKPDRTGMAQQGMAQQGMRLPVWLRMMGQQIHRPLQPDGWPDTAADWLTPPMLAARIDWAVVLPRRVATKADPGALCDRLLGDLAQAGTPGAVRRAEQRWEGVAVLFASPDFMRR